MEQIALDYTYLGYNLDLLLDLIGRINSYLCSLVAKYPADTDWH